MQPAGQDADPSVPTSKSHVITVDVQPAGQAAEPSVVASRSHVRLVSVAEPVQVASCVEVPVQVAAEGPAYA